MDNKELKCTWGTTSDVSSERSPTVVDRRLETFKTLVRHLRGSLWWGRDEEMQRWNPTFVRRDDRKGHPLLSLRKDEVESRFDCIPMLFGTSGGKMSDHGKNCCIDVVGLTRRDPGHHTYFGSIIEPVLYRVTDMMDSVSPKKGECEFIEKDHREIACGGERATLHRRQWYAFKAMIPNQDKPVVTDDEMQMIDDFCSIHEL